MAKATFAAGCFWGIEDAFRKLDGVIETAVGYTGGTTLSPTYEDVCSGATGHAEAVQIEFDPARISFDGLLEAFWQMHDPTQLNRQGPDYGTQYRSAVFAHDAGQEAAARGSLERQQASGRHRRQIVTEIVSAGPFYMAEDYHQQYVEKRKSGLFVRFGR